MNELLLYALAYPVDEPKLFRAHTVIIHGAALQLLSCALLATVPVCFVCYMQGSDVLCLHLPWYPVCSA